MPVCRGPAAGLGARLGVGPKEVSGLPHLPQRAAPPPHPGDRAQGSHATTIGHLRRTERRGRPCQFVCVRPALAAPFSTRKPGALATSTLSVAPSRRLSRTWRSQSRPALPRSWWRSTLLSATVSCSYARTSPPEESPGPPDGTLGTPGGPACARIGSLAMRSPSLSTVSGWAASRTAER